MASENTFQGRKILDSFNFSDDRNGMLLDIQFVTEVPAFFKFYNNAFTPENRGSISIFDQSVASEKVTIFSDDLFKNVNGGSNRCKS